MNCRTDSTKPIDRNKCSVCSWLTWKWKIAKYRGYMLNELRMLSNVNWKKMAKGNVRLCGGETLFNHECSVYVCVCVWHIFFLSFRQFSLDAIKTFHMKLKCAHCLFLGRMDHTAHLFANRWINSKENKTMTREKNTSKAFWDDVSFFFLKRRISVSGDFHYSFSSDYCDRRWSSDHNH